MKILVAGNRGYIGHALTKSLLNKGHEVIGIDNNARENNVQSLGSQSVTGENSIDHENLKQLELDLVDHAKVAEIFAHEKPDAVVNLAHCPSAPYSMISNSKANYALVNNIVGTNNLLWAIKEHTPDSQYVTIGSACEYNHYANIDIEEGYFTFTHNGRESAECIFPRRPGSIYHTSKVASTYLIDFLSRTWDLKTTDVMQGIVFGLYDGVNDNYTRFDTDEAFGTVLNRFCLQAVLGQPLTIYGDGKHKRAFISLRDSVQALELAIENVPPSGRPRVWNQLSEWHSMEDIANLVVEVGSRIGINVEKSYIDTPRTESTQDHYYNFVTENLKEVGFSPERNIREEIEFTMRVLQERIQTIDTTIFEDAVNPKIKWNK